MTTLLAPPEGYDAVKEVAHTRDVLRWLLTLHPNETIRHQDVVDILGRPVCAQGHQVSPFLGFRD